MVMGMYKGAKFVVYYLLLLIMYTSKIDYNVCQGTHEFLILQEIIVIIVIEILWRNWKSEVL